MKLRRNEMCPIHRFTVLLWQGTGSQAEQTLGAVQRIEDPPGTQVPAEMT